MLHMQDNASSHKTKDVCYYLSKQTLNVLPHTPYSPDLGTWDLCLFSLLNDKKAEMTFTASQDIANIVNSQLRWVADSVY